MEIKVTGMKINRNSDEKYDNGGLVASSTILVNNMFLINGVNLVSGKNGLCVLMPGLKKEDGNIQDYAFLVLRKKEKKLQSL